ncbi:MAG: hypothetical protein QM763_25505 [Agriterribacter sp.]
MRMKGKKRNDKGFDFLRDLAMQTIAAMNVLSTVKCEKRKIVSLFMIAYAYNFIDLAQV